MDSYLDLEYKIKRDIVDIERQLKDLPFLDLKFEVSDIEGIIEKSIKDFMANLEERQELDNLMAQVKKDSQELMRQKETLRRTQKIAKLKESRKFNESDLKVVVEKLHGKMAMLKKLESLKQQNETQRSMISRFLGNLCKQGKRKELEEKVPLFLKLAKI